MAIKLEINGKMYKLTHGSLDPCSKCSLRDSCSSISRLCPALALGGNYFVELTIEKGSKPFDFDIVKKHLRKAKEGKLVRTRKGEIVKLFSMDCRGDNPIVGVVCGDTADVVTAWDNKGVNWTGDEDEDLVLID